MSILSSVKQSVVYPLSDKRWVSKTWPLPLIALIPFIGLFSLIIMKGWRFETVKSLHERKELPEFNLFKFIKRGALLWVVMLAYLLVPAIICGVFGLKGITGVISDAQVIMDQGVAVWAKSEPYEWIITFLIYFVWGIISYPVYQSGMIRYVRSGDWKALLNVPANFYLFMGNIHHFIKFYLSWLIILVAIMMVNFVLAITGIGLLIVPALTICLYYSTTAYELSHLLDKVNFKQAINKPELSV